MKAVKLYKRIALIMGIASAICSIIGFFFFLDKVGIVNIEDLLMTEGSEYSSDKIEAILEAADKVDFYISTGDKPGQHGFTYSGDPNDFNYPRYNSGNRKGTCCATYVSWILQEVGLVEDSEHFDWVPTAEDILKKHKWEKITISDIDDLKPGDVGFYRNIITTL